MASWAGTETEAERNWRVTALLDERPVHQPRAYDAPIPGTHWYSSCDPDCPRVNENGVCEGCGDDACSTCGRQDCPNPLCGPDLWGDLYDEAARLAEFKHEEDDDELPHE